MHISTVNISQTIKDRVNNTIAIKYIVAHGISTSIFRFYLHILKVKIKAMNILTANISKMARDRANITIVVKYEVAYGFSISVFAFALGSF